MLPFKYRLDCLIDTSDFVVQLKKEADVIYQQAEASYQSLCTTIAADIPWGHYERHADSVALIEEQKELTAVNSDPFVFKGGQVSNSSMEGAPAGQPDEHDEDEDFDIASTPSYNVRHLSQRLSSVRDSSKVSPWPYLPLSLVSSALTNLLAVKVQHLEGLGRAIRETAYI